ncbi:MAG TPA: PQQ-dependent sugar dehydrogenase, partial [Balneolaceae bacterium]
MKSFASAILKAGFCYSILILLAVSESYAQQGVVSEEITSHIFKPVKVEATQERLNQLEMPEGFTVTKFAENLGKPRMIITGPGGAVYVSRRDKGDVLLLKDTNKDGEADEMKTIIKKENAHGMAIHDGKFYLVTVQEVYSGKLNEDGTVGKLQLLIDDLPVGGQHPNRTIGFGPDSMMYITVGSTSNSYPELNKRSATILQAKPDGSDVKVFAKGLRNTIGFDLHPQTKELYGMDHGIDWLGDNEQKEELNHIKEGADYGWPFIYGDGNFNKADEPDSLTYEEYAAKAEAPVLMHTAHSSPLGMV